MRTILFCFALIHFSPQLYAQTESDARLEKLVQHFEKKEVDLNRFLKDERFEMVDGITKKFTRSAEKRIESLDDYKRVIGFERKAEKATGFYQVYQKELKEAEETYDIPREVIVAIIGVESEFGANSGSYNPLSVYVSMYVEDYRSKFALAQLEELLEFTERNNLDVMEMKGSYAGAMSYAQFIPWSLNRWWVGSDLYDMRNNILSVANYLAHYKEVTGSLEKAVLRYNPSSLYQQAVLALAEETRKFTEISGK